LVLALVLYPYIYLPARAAFASGLSSQLDAARMLGAGAGRRFSRIALPLARPAIVGGALLVAMETLNDFGAVKYFGIRTLTTGIFRSWGGLYDLGSALRLSMVLLGLIVLLLWIERRSRRGRMITQQDPNTPVELRGVRKWAALGWCLLMLFVAACRPLMKIISDVLGDHQEAHWPALLKATANTLLVAGLAVVFTLGIAILFTFKERYGKKPDLLVRLASLGYAIPGAVIAIGVMALAGALDRQPWSTVALIGSLALIIYAYCVRFMAVGLQTLRAGIQQQHPHLDASARMLGAGPWSTFIRINLPLLKPSLIAAAMLVAIDVIKELPLTLILRPFNFETLSTRTYALASIEQMREASWPALLIVLCGVIPVLVLDRIHSSGQR